MTAVFGKELSSYFKNPLGYIYLTVFYLFGGQFLLMQMSYSGTNNISDIFSNMYVVVILALPLLTMRLFAEEKKQHTDQALLTAPVSLAEVVWGKFLAAFALYFFGVAVCILYFGVISSMSAPLWNLFFGNFVGILLLGAALVSIGLFISALTESQVLAAIGTFGCMLFLMGLDSMGGALPSVLSFLAKPLSALSFSARYYDFTSGILDLSHVLFFISVVLVFNFLTIRVLDKNRWVASKRVKSAVLSALVTAVFLVVVVLFNVVFSLVLDRLPSVDLTSNNIYQLSEDSIRAIEPLEQEVEIIVCYSEEDLRSTQYGKQTHEILKGYERHNSGITVRFADLLKEPDISAQYADYGVTNGSIIIRSAKRVRLVSLNDCIETEMDYSNYSYIYKSRAEQVLTSGILYVTEDSVMKASILTGHSEAGCEDIINYLNENNYMVTEQNIATERIDPEAEIAFLFAPTTDYSPQELEELDRFLDNDGMFGKTLIYIASRNQPVLPALESFLSEWGIGVGNSLVVETNSANIYDQQGFMFGAVYGEGAEPYLETVRNSSLPVLGYYSRPLTVLWEEKDNRTAQYLIRTDDSCVLYSLAEARLDISESGETSGYGIAVIGDRLKYIGTEAKRSYVAAFGSNVMFSSSEIVSSNFGNRDFMVELINTLAGKQNGISIPSVSFDYEKLNFSRSDYTTISAVFGALLPGIVFIAGIVVWLRRRRL